MAPARGSGILGASAAALRRALSAPLPSKKTPIPTENRPHSPLKDEAITALIEGEIVPRLLMAHAQNAPCADPSKQRSIDQVGSDLFDILPPIRPEQMEAGDLIDTVEKLLDASVSVESICLDLLAPAARGLGDMWVRDECDFIDVTVGCWRLQEVMRAMSARTPIDPAPFSKPLPRVLFAPMPGDQHNFGPMMLDEVFARAGWDSMFLTKPLRREVLDALAQRRFDVVGLTLTRDCPSLAISNLIKAMRGVSRNPKISILVGGRMINEHPTIVDEVGADGTGADARAALEVAEHWVHSVGVSAHT